MKKALLLLLVALGVYAQPVSVKEFEKLPVFAVPGVEVTRVFDHGSLYEVEFYSYSQRGVSRYTAYLTKDKKSFVMGTAFDTQGQNMLKMKLDHLEDIKKNADITVGTGKEELIVVTDPECHYCQVFEQRWAELGKKYTFYVYLYPLSNHSEAGRMSYYVMNQIGAKAKSDALISIANGETKYLLYTPSKKDKKLFDEKFEENVKLARTLGVKGTPSVFDFYGTFVNWSQLQ